MIGTLLKTAWEFVCSLFRTINVQDRKREEDAKTNEVEQNIIDKQNNIHVDNEGEDTDIFNDDIFNTKNGCGVEGCEGYGCDEDEEWGGYVEGCDCDDCEAYLADEENCECGEYNCSECGFLSDIPHSNEAGLIGTAYRSMPAETWLKRSSLNEKVGKTTKPKKTKATSKVTKKKVKVTKKVTKKVNAKKGASGVKKSKRSTR